MSILNSNFRWLLSNYRPKMFAVYPTMNNYFYLYISKREISFKMSLKDDRVKPKPFSEIPGPNKIPIVDSIKMARKIRRANKRGRVQELWTDILKEYGPFARVELFGKKLVLMGDPNDIEKMYRVTESDPRRDVMKATLKLRRKDKYGVFNKKGGIISEQSEEWKRIRSAIQAPLLKPKNLANYFPILDSEVQNFLSTFPPAKLEETIEPSQSDFDANLRKTCFEIVVRMTLGTKLGLLSSSNDKNSLDVKWFNAAQAFNDSILRMELGDFGSIFSSRYFKRKTFSWQHKNYVDLSKIKFDGICERLQESSAEASFIREKSIFGHLLQNEALSRSDVFTAVIDIIMSGVDNVAYTIHFLLYQLAKHPHYQMRLQNEIQEVMMDKNEITMETLNEMKFLSRVLKETLRLNSVSLGNARLLNREEVFRDFLIPKNTLMFGVHYAIARDEKYFAQPLDFKPERWERNKPLGEIHNYASLPFSYGIRLCTGKRLTINELSVFMIRLFQKYRVTLDPKHDMEVTSYVTLRPKSLLPFKFTRRE